MQTQYELTAHWRHFLLPCGADIHHWMASTLEGSKWAYPGMAWHFQMKQTPKKGTGTELHVWILVHLDKHVMHRAVDVCDFDLLECIPGKLLFCWRWYTLSRTKRLWFCFAVRVTMIFQICKEREKNAIFFFFMLPSNFFFFFFFFQNSLDEVIYIYISKQVLFLSLLFRHYWSVITVALKCTVLDIQGLVCFVVVLTWIATVFIAVHCKAIAMLLCFQDRACNVT